VSNPTLGELSKKDNWQTPEWVWSGIADHIGGFDCDPCAGERTQIGDWNYYVSLGMDGLSWPWFGDVWVNPPFSYKSDWVEHCVKQHQHNDDVDRIFLLTPDSTDVRSWFHKQIVPNAKYVWFADGRVKFREPETGESAGSPSFGTAISVFGEIPPGLRNWFHSNGWLARTASESARGFGVTD